ncbi:Crp/Fnr family transcriptional regulator [Salinarimonas ramus]|uniref:Crp/Fnr family transcriptional regulator n=1 Tax=Salinarimonas ramus TaxID=690164 RepID=UPI00166EF1F8|nr:Crp/Fnr family transcriptional regulator [Salinarimonas ramus]
MIAIMSDSFASLFDVAETRPLHAGSWLFHDGDPVRIMYFVVEGAVDLTRLTDGGVSVMQQRARPGQVLAEASAYSARYHCDARAVTATVVRAVPVARFLERLAADRLLAEVWAAHLARAVQAARMRAEILTLRTVAERLDAWLREGRALPAKGAWQDVAAEIGVSREALYRELSRRRREPP